MPTLDWIGKKAVVNHHREVPYHLLKCDRELSVGDPGSGNLLVQGDNLLALRALLPYYAGRVKCIYIDPPYNTGNESWIYNDAVNSPEIRKWLGKVVGADAEDLSRHDKWLCMMYPRLMVLRSLLREDGVLFVSIDDNEAHYLRSILDEIFSARNFVTTFVWRKVDSPNDNKVAVTPDHEFVLCYALNREKLRLRQMVDASLLDAYHQKDENGRLFRDRLLKKNGKNSLRQDRPTMFFELTAPDGTKVFPIHDDGREANWALSPTGVESVKTEGRLIWKNRGSASKPKWVPYTREFAPSIPQRPYPSIWLDVLTTRQAKAHHRKLFSTEIPVFPTPKPEQLIHRIVTMCSDPGDIILDSFAGSGTTAAVAHKLGRQWITIELHDHAITHIAPRLKGVVAGEDDGGISALAGWQGGGGFRYCRLGPPIFDETGDIRAGVTFSELAAHVYFTETGEPLPKRTNGKTPLLGVHNGKAVYLLFNGILGDRSPGGGNVLTNAVLRALPAHDGPRILYGEGSRLGAARLKREGIVFRQIPYGIKTR
jgi:adenine-specific DNA-methyltransferase